MNKEEKNIENEKIHKILSKFIDIYNEAELNSKETNELISSLMYSIGTSLVGKTFNSSTEAIEEYIDNPTYGSVLIAQAIYMNDLWNKEEREKHDN
jgi:hypothetical protein